MKNIYSKKKHSGRRNSDTEDKPSHRRAAIGGTDQQHKVHLLGAVKGAVKLPFKKRKPKKLTYAP